jgi:peptidyl-tRNA hydrolase
MANHPERLKMYLLVLDDVPLGFAVNSIAHAAVGSVVTWLEEEEAWAMGNALSNTQPTRKEKEQNAIVHEWLNKSFKKVSCVVTPEQFEQAKTLPDAIVFSESDLGDREVSLALKPRYRWPSMVSEWKMIGEEG